VLLKSGAPPLTFDGLYQFFTEGLYERLSFSIVGYNTVASQRLLLLLPLTYLLFRRQLKEAVSYHYQIILLMAAVFVHLSFAGFVHFPRYEAYLIGCSVAITGSLVAKYGAGLFRTKQILLQWMGGVTTALILSPLFIRSKDAFRDIGQACINIYEQQYQMGQLLHRYYNTSSVAIGDIGAVSYFTEGKNLDLVGLANIEVARSKKNNYYTPNFLYELNKREKVKVAICYEYYTYPQLFLRWTKVATWTIPNNVTCGDATVSIFAVDPAEKDNLVKHLREFESHLPRDVTVRYYY
jgi:hypothetical protein